MCRRNQYAMARGFSKLFSFLFSLQILAATVPTAVAADASARWQVDGAELTVDGGTLRIQFWSPEIVRVTYAPGTELPNLKSLSVVAKPDAVKLTHQENSQA